MIFALAGIKAVKQLLETDDIRPSLGCQCDLSDGFVDVLQFGLAARHLHDGESNGTTWFRSVWHESEIHNFEAARET
jgi:hypothetical protein